MTHGGEGSRQGSVLTRGEMPSRPDARSRHVASSAANGGL